MDEFNAFKKAIDGAIEREIKGVTDNRHKSEDYLSFKNKCYSCGKRIEKDIGTVSAPEGIGFICKECVYSRM